MIAESFEKMHKNHLVGMGIAPLQFAKGESAHTLELSGKERFTISVPKELAPLQELTVKVGCVWSTVCLRAKIINFSFIFFFYLEV